jgi:hypothetical protein
VRDWHFGGAKGGAKRARAGGRAPAGARGPVPVRLEKLGHLRIILAGLDLAGRCSVRDEIVEFVTVLRNGTYHTLSRMGECVAVLRRRLCCSRAGHAESVQGWQTCSRRVRGVPL